MSTKLSVFFDSKKKKALKTSNIPVKTAKEEPKDLFVDDGENNDEGEWAVLNETGQDKPCRKCGRICNDVCSQNDSESSGASWMKVSVIDTLPTSKREEKRTWGSLVGNEKEKDIEEKKEEDVGRKWVSPSLRKHQQFQTANKVGSTKISFENDPSLDDSLLTVLSKKKSALPDKNVVECEAVFPKERKEKKMKEKDKTDGENDECSGIAKFDVWDYVKFDLLSIEGADIVQDDEASRNKYLSIASRVSVETS